MSPDLIFPVNHTGDQPGLWRGGNSGAPLNADYVELHNISSVSQKPGWFIHPICFCHQHGSLEWCGRFTIREHPPGGYFLIQMSSTGTNGAALPDRSPASPTIAMSATSGR